MKKWLKQRVGALSREDLVDLFNEISEFRSTGILKGDKLETLECEASEYVHTPIGENMRLVEDAILFEISRRYVANI